MPYPSKTDRQTILDAAMEQLAAGGLRGLSLRTIAASLELAPNALYRYFTDRNQLESAMAAESLRRLHRVLERTARHKEPREALRAMARAYLRFAREHRHLYDLQMSIRPAPGNDEAHQELWMFVVREVRRLAPEAHAAEAAVALWAFLHGMAVLEAGDVLGKQKPSGFRFGLDAWLTAAAGDAPAATAPQLQPRSRPGRSDAGVPHRSAARRR